MRLRNRPWAASELNECPYYIRSGEAFRGRWKERFGNDHPIHLELGCGKGMYLRGAAVHYPEVNFIGADIKSLMLAYARRNIQLAFDENGLENSNVLLLSVDAERILNAFSAEDEIHKLIINFSNPWPKPKHHKKRLTHPRQLENYKQFLMNGAVVEFKTDNDEYYSDSLGYFETCGYSVVESSFDYYQHRPIDETILTEHESKFISLGLPIHHIKAVFNKLG